MIRAMADLEEPLVMPVRMMRRSSKVKWEKAFDNVIGKHQPFQRLSTKTSVRQTATGMEVEISVRLKSTLAHLKWK